MSAQARHQKRDPIIRKHHKKPNPGSRQNWIFAGFTRIQAAIDMPQRNSLPSTHIRCTMTASLRATATRARAMPRRLAMFMPQARNADHLVLRINNEWAAS